MDFRSSKWTFRSSKWTFRSLKDHFKIPKTFFRLKFVSQHTTATALAQLPFKSTRTKKFFRTFSIFQNFHAFWLDHSALRKLPCDCERAKKQEKNNWKKFFHFSRDLNAKTEREKIFLNWSEKKIFEQMEKKKNFFGNSGGKKKIQISKIPLKIQNFYSIFFFIQKFSSKSLFASSFPARKLARLLSTASSGKFSSHSLESFPCKRLRRAGNFSSEVAWCSSQCQFCPFQAHWYKCLWRNSRSLILRVSRECLCRLASVDCRRSRSTPFGASNRRDLGTQKLGLD